MWQKAKVIYCESEALKVWLNKTIWIQCGPPTTAFDQIGVDEDNPANWDTPYLREKIPNYISNVHQDINTEIRLGFTSKMLELLPIFCENPPLVPFTQWSSENA